MYLNRLSILGFLGADGEKKSTASGQIYTILSVATKTSWKDNQGDWQSHTEWHRVIVWGEQFAEYAAGLKKGSHVLVEGGLRSREYEKDGVKHRMYECKADSILKLDRPERSEHPAADSQPVSEEVVPS
jgi:single-strand DNA-binding protein